MIKKTITYTDYFGDVRTEDHYFNLTRSEVTQFEHSHAGGMSTYLRKIAQENDTTKLVPMVEEFILMCYGERSEDGRRFIKSPELSKAFKETRAYDEMFMELFVNPIAFAEFINGAFEIEVPENLKMLEDLKKEAAEAEISKDA